MTQPNRRVYCHTLGCDKNLVDSEALLGRFAARGVEAVADPEAADIWLVNTCGFIEAARRDSDDAIAAFAAAKGERTLVVTGCLAQEHGDEIRARHPEVDVVGGVGEFDRVVAAALAGFADWLAVPALEARYEGLVKRPLLTPPHVAFVKIGEGCNQTCTFCRIPLIRGTLRSRPIAAIVDEVRGLVDGGVREIQLVSQNTSDYGRGTGEDLEALLAALAAVADLRRIRLLYLYAGLFPAERALRILELPKVVPYLDLPIQHASPRLLRAMRRPGDPAKAAAFFRTLRRERPDVVLRSTALVGFPGEEEEDVEQLLDFLAEVRFDHLGTYRFSPERGTPAALLADRPADEEVADREARVLDLQSGISGARMADRLGESFEIVIDELLAPGAPDSRERASELGGALLDGVWRTPADRAQAAALIAAGPRLALGRSLHFGYDLDGVVVLPATGDLGPGEWCTGRFTGATPWDVWAERVQ
ncbi:MAG TPA: 30S ribosomal protein S12 methylthiotransferase RimO [Candidatus Krumholzibacteria bacterium]|nr:30S ribosomal protein S12 methylthiotransferase RimO [Candidatus Krumholzibacteria bacterium]HPD71712.1 30S ribosomal protein S12 methylthiotransferase RimO [Candidatus Krumholzibacteria bacterium]HRY41355.1 30S ribosomal protein S12 methylthiotransferase RimO [Candidatus Krumholzibacteria bacterium]